MRSLTAMAMVMGMVGALALVACDDGGPDTVTPPEPVPVPEVQSLSVDGASVGDEIQIQGSNFISADRGYTEVTFRGVYRHDGVDEPVNYTVEAGRDNENTLTMRFGPYRIPFSRAGNQLGTFEGEIFATNYTHDGREQRQSTDFREISFDVRPSLVVRDLESSVEDVETGDVMESDCNFIGTRLINHVPYKMTVEAVGFEPDEFIYSISAGLQQEDSGTSEPSTINHLAASRLDSLGENENFVFGGVPMGAPVYRASVSIDAVSTTGEHFEQFMMVTVHQPLYVRYLGGVEVAEIMEPEPVSGCIPGGVQGRQATYSETVTETKTLTTTHSLSSGWTESYTEQHSETYGEGGTEANAIGFSRSDENNWNWNVNGSVMAGGEAGVPLVTKGKVEVRVGGGRDWGGSHTNTQSGEQSWTQTATYNEAHSMTEQHSELFDETNTEAWTVSTATSTLQGFTAFLLPNHFGVWYRQTTRLVRRAEIVAMDLCGNETVVGELILNDYTWAPDLAMGTSCPPFPESLLPQAECFIEPCEGQ